MPPARISSTGRQTRSRKSWRSGCSILNRKEKLLEKQRLEQRTRYDVEALRQFGVCPGIENYSRHIDGRRPGERPYTLFDYFPDDFLLVVDESHVSFRRSAGCITVTVPRKETLVNFGFRLPSALDNRPLRFEEFEKMVNQAIYVSEHRAIMNWKRYMARSLNRSFVRPVFWIRSLKFVRQKDRSMIWSMRSANGSTQ